MLDDDKKIICPDCQMDIAYEEPVEIGSIFECSECGCEVELVATDPWQYRTLVEQK